MPTDNIYICTICSSKAAGTTDIHRVAKWEIAVRHFSQIVLSPRECKRPHSNTQNSAGDLMPQRMMDRFGGIMDDMVWRRQGSLDTDNTDRQTRTQHPLRWLEYFGCVLSLYRSYRVYYCWNRSSYTLNNLVRNGRCLSRVMLEKIHIHQSIAILNNPLRYTELFTLYAKHTSLTNNIKVAIVAACTPPNITHSRTAYRAACERIHTKHIFVPRICPIIIIIASLLASHFEYVWICVRMWNTEPNDYTKSRHTKYIIILRIKFIYLAYVKTVNVFRWVFFRVVKYNSKLIVMGCRDNKMNMNRFFHLKTLKIDYEFIVGIDEIDGMISLAIPGILQNYIWKRQSTINQFQIKKMNIILGLTRHCM